MMAAIVWWVPCVLGGHLEPCSVLTKENDIKTFKLCSKLWPTFSTAVSTEVRPQFRAKFDHEPVVRCDKSGFLCSLMLKCDFQWVFLVFVGFRIKITYQDFSNLTILHFEVGLYKPTQTTEQ
jgi:hypothetical protein